MKIIFYTIILVNFYAGICFAITPEVLFTEDFSGGKEHWWVEGGKRVWVEGGRLYVDADPKFGKKGKSATIWFRQPVSGDVKISYDAHVLSSSSGVNNINTFLFYNDPSGRPLEQSADYRADGKYSKYHGLNGNIITFVNSRTKKDVAKARIRIRKAPGFKMLAETYAYHCEIGRTYHIEINRQGETLTFAVDGKKLLTAEDSDPIDEGLLGFRSFGTFLWLDNLRVEQLSNYSYVSTKESKNTQSVTLPGKGLRTIDDRSVFPHYLNFRPGNGQIVDINPPRFSWPYFPQVLPPKNTPRSFFTLQLSSEPSFKQPDIKVSNTPYNFYNALSPLTPGIWYWRIGYNSSTSHEYWTPPRTFTIPPKTAQWDRKIINSAVKLLADQPHPRLGPRKGDWRELYKKLNENSKSSPWLNTLIQRAIKTTQNNWWNDFPVSDDPQVSGLKKKDWVEIAEDLSIVALAYRLTGNDRYLYGKTLVARMAEFKKGGDTSPAFHARGKQFKWSTQITEFMALCYDWWYPELENQEQQVIQQSIAWRLKAIYFIKKSWQNPNGIEKNGVSVKASSHAYQNFMWGMPAVLLTTGDIDISNRLTPLVLNYLTGVNNSFGPDEAWNEGLSYGNGKGRTMLEASIYTDLLLPELHIGTSPYYRRLGEWYAGLLPNGIRRLSFGNNSAWPAPQFKIQRDNFRYLWYLTNDKRAGYRYLKLSDKYRGGGNRPWLSLLISPEIEKLKAGDDYNGDAVFTEAGWVMASSRPPSDRKAFDDAIGMIFKCRPRGGYSHSFRSENDFVWYALGQTLSVGAGGRFPDPYSHSTISHNAVLVNGQGQKWDTNAPIRPYNGRLIAYKRMDGLTWWVGDATYAYQTVPKLRRWHRYVLFIDNRFFVIFDDLAMSDDADPALFSWMFHIDQDVDLKIDGTTFTYQMGDVHAAVSLANSPDEVNILDLQGVAGYKNPITGKDLYPKTKKISKKKKRRPQDTQILAHNLFVTNRERTNNYSFLATLTAWRDGKPSPKVKFIGRNRVTVVFQDGKTYRISFDPTYKADINIDIEKIRLHAEKTAKVVLHH